MAVRTRFQRERGIGSWRSCGKRRAGDSREISCLGVDYESADGTTAAVGRVEKTFCAKRCGCNGFRADVMGAPISAGKKRRPGNERERSVTGIDLKCGNGVRRKIIVGINEVVLRE